MRRIETANEVMELNLEGHLAPEKIGHASGDSPAASERKRLVNG